MEKAKNKLTQLGYVAALAIFAVSALASSSSKDTIKHVDDFVDGYNYGKSLWSDATDESDPLPTDSIMPDEPLVATND